MANNQLYISFAGRIRNVVCLFPFNFLLSKLINQFESIMQNEPNFTRLRPIHNIRKNQELQQKINNGHLVKTNPIKPNQSQYKPNLP
ncbi:MAG: hypothetical protein JSV99_05190, partial [Planctomycetota bacterium]